MGKIRFLIILILILLVGLTGGLFVAENDAEVALALLWTVDSYSITAGMLSLAAFAVGFTAALLLCVAHLILQSLELRLTRRKLRKVEKELDGMRTLAAKDAP